MIIYHPHYLLIILISLILILILYSILSAFYQILDPILAYFIIHVEALKLAEVLVSGFEIEGQLVRLCMGERLIGFTMVTGLSFFICKTNSSIF